MEFKDKKSCEKNVVCQYIDGLGSGGIEAFVLNVFDHIDRKKISFDFIIDTEENTRWDDFIKQREGHIIAIFKETTCLNPITRKIEKAKRFAQIIRERQYRVVHVHMSYPSTLLYCYIAKKCGVSTIIAHAHASAFGSYGGLAEKMVSVLSKLFFLKYCDFLFAASEKAGKYMFGTRNYRVIQNGIDIKKYQFNQNVRNQLRAELKIKQNEILVGHVGRFALAKNHDFIIDIFNEYLKLNKNAKLLLIGEGELQQIIEKKTVQYDLRDKVIFYGFSDKVNQLMQAMDILLLPSLSEGLGIVAIEAQAAGLPVLMSDTVPEETVILDNVLQCSLRESAAHWAESIGTLLDKGRINEAQNRVYNRGYDINSVSEELMELYLQ